MNQSRPSLWIIGRGRLGGALWKRAWRRWPRARSIESAGLIFLTVPDDAIQEVAGSLQLSANTVVAHCSGALSSTVLETCRQQGAKVASAHPMQTFPSAEAGAAAWPGTHVFLEGDGEAVLCCTNFIRALGGIPHRLATEQKAMYHAGAVMACNHLVAVLDSALKMLQSAGLDEQTASEALAPLVTQTVKNVFAHPEKGPEKALTGPVARGDAETIAQHLQVIDEQELYRLLALRTLEVAKRAGLDDHKARQIEKNLQTR